MQMAGKPERIVRIEDWVGKDIHNHFSLRCLLNILGLRQLFYAHVGTFSFSCALTSTCMSVHVERLDAHTRRVTSDTMILEVAGKSMVCL